MSMIDSPEFAEWRAYFRLYDEAQTGDRGEPTADELGAKIHQWAAGKRKT